MNKILRTISVLVLLACAMHLSSSQSLVFVQHLFRHGARYPIYNVGGVDGSGFAFSQKLNGQLTTPGKSMHYLLGQQLYTDYWSKLFKDTPNIDRYNQSKFYMKSTDVNRTIESMQSQMVGLFEKLPNLELQGKDMDYSYPPWSFKIPPGVGPVFVNAPRFHPSALHIQKIEMNPFDKGDFLRTYDPSVCQNQKKWQQQNLQSLTAQPIINDPLYLKEIAALEKAIGKPVSFQDAYKYYDNWLCIKYVNSSAGLLYFRTLSQQSQRIWDSLLTIDLHLKLFYTKKQISATSTGYFNATINNIKNIIDNPNGVQWAMYSAHDTTVANMMAALNLTNVECVYDVFKRNVTTSDTCLFKYPTFASTLIFQLYKQNNNTYTVKIRYNGQYRKIPFCGYKMDCPVESMYAWYDQLKDEKYDQTCGIYDDHGDRWFTLSIVEGGVILIALIYVMVKWLEKNTIPHAPKKQLIEEETNAVTDAIPHQPQIKQSLLSQQ